MYLLHMPIAFPPLIKRLQTHPTYMRLAIPALHMIAPIRLLDRHFAHGTVLDVVLLLPLPKLVVALRSNALVCLAGHAIVTGDLAGSADWSQASGTGEDDPIGRDAVDLLAVWGGTVLEGLWVRPDVCGEGVFQ